MVKNLVLGPILARFARNLVPENFLLKVSHLSDVIHCYKLLLYPTSKKTNKPNFRKCQKT